MAAALDHFVEKRLCCEGLRKPTYIDGIEPGPRTLARHEDHGDLGEAVIALQNVHQLLARHHGKLEVEHYDLRLRSSIGGQHFQCLSTVARLERRISGASERLTDLVSA